MKRSTPRRFRTHLDGLNDEFELMVQEIESLQKERDQYKAKVEELQRKSVCEQCTKENTGVSQSIRLSWLKTLRNATSKPVLQSKSADKQSTSGTRNVVPSHHTDRPAQGTNLQELSTIKLSECVAQTTPLAPTSTDAREDIKIPDWFITYNTEVKNELDVEMVHTLLHERTVASVKFSQDGKYLAAGCDDGKAYIYNSQTGILTCVLRNLLEEERIVIVCFSVDGKYLATGVGEGDIYIREIKTKYLRNAFKGHTRSVRTLQFSPNSRLLLFASWDDTIRVWNMRYGSAKILTDDNYMTGYRSFPSAVFCCNGKFIAASLNSDQMLRIWDACTGQLIRKVTTGTGMYDVACMPDGDALVAGCHAGVMKYWDIGSLVATRLASRSQIAISSTELYSEERIVERGFSGHKDSVKSVAVTHDGRWIASGSDDKSVRIWDTRDAVTQCILSDSEPIYRVDFSPADCLLASARDDGAVRIWRHSTVAMEGNCRDFKTRKEQ